MTEVHSCSYYCDRLECIKAQRDELRSRLESMTDREIMQRALEALEWVNTSVWLEDCYHAFDEEVAALRERLAQPEQEPAQRTWVGLTDEEIESLDCVYLNWLDYERVETKGEKEFARAIESKLKEKNT